MVRQLIQRTAIELQLAGELFALFEALHVKYTPRQIQNAYVNGGIAQVLRMLGTIQPDLARVLAPILVQEIMKNGLVLDKVIPSRSLAEGFVFSITERHTAQAIQEYTAVLIRDIEMSTFRSIVQAVERGVSLGLPPVKVARDIRQSIGLTRAQENIVQNFRRSLEERDKEKLVAMLQDENYILRDHRFDASLRSLLNDKAISQDKIDRMVGRYRERWVKFRSEVIANTELFRAKAIGEYESVRQAMDEGKLDNRLRRFWVFTPDERTRAHHRDIPGMNTAGVGMYMDFKTPQGPLRYPLDPKGVPSNVINCRCKIQYRIPG
jgi:hypothetical protein